MTRDEKKPGFSAIFATARKVRRAALRVREAIQMGFTRLVMPAVNVDPAEPGFLDGGIDLVGVRTVGEALDALIA